MMMKCPNCGGPLKFDEKQQKVICEFCLSSFDVNDLQHKNVKMVKMSRKDIVESGIDDDSYMGLNVYSCTSCGAQIRVNGVEASTFCSFCGQPTVLFDRVEKSLKPKYILPFTFPKEHVEQAVRNKLNKGFFVPEEIKEFKTECIRGIYIPFWLLDVNYSSSMIIRGSHKSGKTTVTTYYYRKGNALFKDITLDASNQLADESSQRLEPYNLSTLKPFNINYLTGFYADSMDVNGDPIDEIAKKRSQYMFHEEMLKTVKDNDLSVMRENKNVQIMKRSYAMLPVWFLSFHAQQTPYTYLINGQTGKVIGAVNFERKKSYGLMIILSILFSIVAIFIVTAMVYGASDAEDAFKTIVFAGVVAAIVAGTGYGFQTTIQENMELSQSENMFNLVKKRQENH